MPAPHGKFTDVLDEYFIYCYINYFDSLHFCITTVDYITIPENKLYFFPGQSV